MKLAVFVVCFVCLCYPHTVISDFFEIGSPLISQEYGAIKALELEAALDSVGDVKYREDYYGRLSQDEKAKFTAISLKYDYQKYDETLVQVIIVARHAEHVPDFFPPLDPLGLEPYWKLFGPGTLTTRGRERMFFLGRLFKGIYGKFLAKYVNRQQLLLRSARTPRVQESLEQFINGLLDELEPANSVYNAFNRYYNPLANLYIPESYLVLPELIDPLLGLMPACKALAKEYELVQLLPDVVKLFEPFQEIADTLNALLGYKITPENGLIWYKVFKNIEIEYGYFPDKLDPIIVKLLPKIKEAADLAIGIYAQGTQKITKLHVGFLVFDLVNQMSTIVKQIESGVELDSPQLNKFLFYSAHGPTIQLLLAALDIFDKFPYISGYGSNIVFELHKKKAFYIKIFYMPTTPSELIDITLEVCQTETCTLKQLELIVHDVLIKSFFEYSKECTFDLVDLDFLELL